MGPQLHASNDGLLVVLLHPRLLLRESPDCPSLRASDEHSFIVRVLRARRMVWRLPSYPSERPHSASRRTTRLPSSYTQSGAFSWCRGTCHAWTSRDYGTSSSFVVADRAAGSARHVSGRRGSHRGNPRREQDQHPRRMLKKSARESGA